jgi:cellobiose epimerase
MVPACVWLWACSASDARVVPLEAGGSVAGGSPAGGAGGAGESSSVPGPPGEGVATSDGVRGSALTPLDDVPSQSNVGDSAPNGTSSSITHDIGAPTDAGVADVDAGAGDVDAGVGLGSAPPDPPRHVDAGLEPDVATEPLDPELARLGSLSRRLTPLAERTVAFWLEHGPDQAFGGFHATLDRSGLPTAPTGKGLVQQARHLWMLSTWYERRDRSAELAELAATQYAFLTHSFLDAADGAFVLGVSRDGRQMTDRRKQLYAESFALYALSTYGRVFDVPDAVALALARFERIDAARHDATFGGYDQRGDPGFLSVGAEKDTNTHLHLMEAFSALYEATGDARVGARLDELAGLIATTLRQPSDYVHSEFLLDWTPFGAPRVSYGHDLESAWLLLEAARVLGRPADAELGAAALAIAEHSASRGFDSARGGYFESGVPAGPATDLDKIWWVQFEALSGLWWAYELGGGSIQLDRLDQTLGWLETTEDLPIGEWFATTNPDGTAAGGLDYKGDEWKESYHSVRALVFVQDWIDEARARKGSAPKP